jgi:2-polyprenyl-3-methyl-5-hydroxy-6-metoxy-1,4-benzoquinol methylase
MSADAARHAQPPAFSRFERCPLCGSRDIKQKFAAGGFTVMKCGGCSLYFVGEIVGDDYLKNYYATADRYVEDYRVYSEKDNEKNLKYAHAAVAKRIKRHFNFQSGLNILDLGCSNGSLLEQFPEWNVYGIELNETTGKIAQAKHKNIFIGDMKDADFERGFFDCITITDALDHSNDPNFVVGHCHSLLKPGGIIVIKVHNIDCLLAKLTGGKFYAIVPPEHLVYFNLRTLKLLLEKHNFEFSGHFYNTQKLKIENAIMRAAATFPFLKILERMAVKTFVGKIPIYKNFHDIVTVVGVKK